MQNVSGRDWVRVAAMAAVGGGLAAAGVMVTDGDPAAPWVVAVFAACVVLLFNQPLILDIGEHVLADDMSGIVVMVGLVALSPGQLLVVWLGGRLVGWAAHRCLDRIPPASSLAWIKLVTTLGTGAVHVGVVLLTYQVVRSGGLIPPALAAAVSVVGGLLLEILASAVAMGKTSPLPVRQVVVRILAEPIPLVMLVFGGLSVQVVELGGEAVLVAVVGTASLWGLAWGHNRRQSELRHRRAFVDTIQMVPATGDRDEVAAVLVDRARELTHAARASLEAEPPTGESVGVLVDDDGVWLNVHGRLGGAERFRRHEYESLEGLGAIGHLALRAADLAEQLRRAALHDSLTGVLSRRGLDERWTVLVRRAARRGSGVGVLFVDLDGFKLVNDQQGHAAGDEVLRQAARRLASVARETDLVCRLGGDEFVLVADDLADDAALEILRERVAAVLAGNEAVHPGAEGPGTDSGRAIRASIGTAFHRDANLALEDALRLADERMYEQKRATRSNPGSR